MVVLLFSFDFAIARRIFVEPFSDMTFEYDCSSAYAESPHFSAIYTDSIRVVTIFTISGSHYFTSVHNQTNLLGLFFIETSALLIWRGDDGLPSEELLVHPRNDPRSLPAADPHALHTERLPAPRLPVGEYRGVETYLSPGVINQPAE